MASTLNFIIALTFAVLAVSAASGSRIVGESLPSDIRSNDLIVGSRQPNDRLVYQEIINKKASLIGKKVILEQKFHALRDYVITEVRALDLAQKGTGATVTVSAGGPGLENIVLRFKSQRFHGIHFVVQVFAKQK